MAKIALIKLGTNFSANTKNNNQYGANTFIRLFDDLGFDVHHFSDMSSIKKMYNEYGTPHQMDELVDTVNDYDALIVVAGRINIYGGVVQNVQAKQYRAIRECKKPLVYLHIDTALPFINEGRRFTLPNKTIDSLPVYDTYSVERKDWFLITHAHGINKIINKFDKNFGAKWIKYFPVYNFAYWYTEDYSNGFEREWDMYYGGSYRYGKRTELIYEHLFNLEQYNIKSAISGNKMDLDLFDEFEYKSHPEVLGKLNKEDYLKTVANSKMTFIPYDKNIPDVFHVPRIYEAIVQKTLPLIPAEHDREKIIFGKSRLLSDWLYFSNHLDYITSIKAINENNDLRLLLRNELQKIIPNRVNYLFEFTNIMEVILNG